MSDPATELSALRTRLWLALCCAPVVFSTPLACTDGTSAEATKPTEKDAKVGSLFGGDKSNEHSSDDGPTTALPPEPYPMPTCPSGQWCGTEALAEPLRIPDTTGHGVPDFEGCPGQIGDGDIAKDQVSRYEGLPVQMGIYATINVEASKAKRSEGGAEADACCYEWMELCPGGRPLLDEGRPQLAKLRAGSRWTAKLSKLDREAIARLPHARRETIAAAWLDDARMEHSSIASFARARLELVTVGAPAALVLGCERAAVDERRHARICFGLAAAYGGAAVEPEPLAELSIRDGGLVRVAIDTFIEGCVGETVAAACVRRAASEAHDPELGRLLARIADDEADHAALAWQTLAWAIDQGGQSVRQALRAVADQLRPASSKSEAAEPADRELVSGHGRLSAASQARLRRAAWVTIIDPLLAEQLTRL
jgi:hypothetical protein